MSAPETVIRGALWKGEPFDLAISGGRISRIEASGKGLEAGAEEVRADGLVLMPGLIDVHAHFREPGQEYKEDISSGLMAAAAGGFQRVMTMANTVPVNDSASITGAMLTRARESHPDGPLLSPVGALTVGLDGRELAPMHELKQAGCVAFSNDGRPVEDSELFRRALEYASDLGLLVIDHCEDAALSRSGVMNEGATSDRLGLPGQPTLVESIQVARDILMAGYLETPIHLAHISCRESVELIASAKRKGIPVTAETCPHYLIWDETRVEGYDTRAKVNPPLRTRDDSLALLQALREGIIDILATDHAPHAAHEKEVPFADAPNGISGLETALPLTWSLVDRGELTIDDLIRLWCRRPAEIFGFGHPELEPGRPANLILFDPQAVWRVTPERLRSKGTNTPCLGQELTGRVRGSYLAGRLIHQEK
jgi:dihydroorotase